MAHTKQDALRVRASPPAARLEGLTAATDGLLLTKKHAETHPLSSIHARCAIKMPLRDADCRDSIILQ